MKTEAIEYREGSTVCEGFAGYAYDDKARRPGVVIVRPVPPAEVAAFDKELFH